MKLAFCDHLNIAGVGGGHGSVDAGSAFGLDLAKQGQTGVRENSMSKPICKTL